jgi:D-alanyl-D-alanine carboxypeptidase
MPTRKRPAAVAISWPHRSRAVLSLILLCVLAGCATQHGGGSYGYRLHRTPTHYYPPPGPPNDPWGPYIHDASSRFGVPELWIREVMRQESGGDETAVSSAGAVGLMQLMPSTYETLREQYGLGDDPFEPHDNVLAGTAYIRQMYDRYGSPGFLAAYNAGPQRVDDYLATGDPLPNETVGYLA